MSMAPASVYVQISKRAAIYYHIMTININNMV